MTPQDLLALVRAAAPPGLTVTDFLAQGGQGAVFRGSLNGEAVAVKLFDPASDLRRLARELEIYRTISSPHLVRVRSFHTIVLIGQPVPVVCYEFHSGGDLTACLAPSAPALAAEELVAVALGVGAAVDELWARRIVHRDIKPANILKAADGRVVLADVGLARHLDRSTITLPGAACGTRGYMSPEQARGRRNLTVHSDVFSLGVTLFELATKQHPWNRNHAITGTLAPLVDLAAVRPDLPPRLVQQIRRLLAAAPHQRPTSVVASFSAQ